MQEFVRKRFWRYAYLNAGLKIYYRRRVLSFGQRPA